MTESQLTDSISTVPLTRARRKPDAKTPGPRLKGPGRLDNQLIVKVRTEDLETIDKLAAAVGLPRSDYVRRRCGLDY